MATERKGDAFARSISDTAFLVNESRARNTALSRDRYAHLWVSEKTRALWEAFDREVYPHDALQLGLRNRFFLENLEKRLASGQAKTFVNIGAGFTSYPFLVEAECRFVEVDYEDVIRFKREKVARFRGLGLLPDRSIEFLGADLRSPGDRRWLEGKLASFLAAEPSIVFIEGLTYYLEKPVLLEVLALLCRVQQERSFLVFDYWTPDNESRRVFRKTAEFFERRFGCPPADYNYLTNGFAQRIDGYRVVEITDVQELEKRYAGTSLLADPDEIIPESYAVLERTDHR